MLIAGVYFACIIFLGLFLNEFECHAFLLQAKLVVT
jgi:hypothetical protein